MATIKLAGAIKWIKENPRIDFEIKFLKKDGSIRLMKCKTGFDDGTLVKDPMKANRPEPVGLIKVYDIDKKSYRSFNESSLLSIKTSEQQGWLDIEEKRIVSGQQTS